MPNHGKEKIAWGQDFPVLCKRIVETIDSVQNVDRKILVAHDWGCVYGYFIDRVNILVIFRNILTTSDTSSLWMFQHTFN